jgi:glucose/arabinose dehydrogenase
MFDVRRATSISLALAALLLASSCGVQKASDASDVTTVAAHGATKGLRLVRVGSFDAPIGVVGAPTDPSRVFVIQKGGQVELILNGKPQSRAFLDLGSSVNSGGGEQGLIGLAFPSDYTSTGIFYVDYTLSNNDVRIAQFRRSAGDPNIADPASGHTVLTIDHHEFTNHNGGQLAFGPDGDLYIGVGDGGSEGDPNNNGQNTDSLLGKILRIDPSPGGGYTIPSGNPFAGQPGHRAEIWAYGLRNPWRFSFDHKAGSLIIGDVGQDQEEEIDFAAAGTGAGTNYGWSVWEGTRRNKSGSAPHAVFPKLVLQHTSGYCAIIGGVVVRDRSLGSLYGHYLFGDNCRPQIEAAKLSAHGASGLHATGLKVNGTTSFGEDANRHVYIASLDGTVYRIASR